MEFDRPVRRDWVGHRLGLSPGTWRYIGDVREAKPGDEYVEPRYDPSIESPPERNPPVPVLIESATRRVYEVKMPAADRATLAAELTRLGFANPSVPDGVEVAEESEQSAFVDGADREVQKEWSGATDDRVDLGIARYGVGAWPYATIGQVKIHGLGPNGTGHCTGTFIGNPYGAERYVVTAAHCLFYGNGAWVNPEFYPRQDGCVSSQGTFVPGCNPAPFGMWYTTAAVGYSYFLQNCAGQDPVPNGCLAYDIAILRVALSGSGSWPGAMGFGFWTKSYLDWKTKYHRGYPNCENDDGLDPQPAPGTGICLWRTLYGAPQSTTNNGGWFLDGYPRRYRHDSDTSRGHSGGPTYMYDSPGPMLFGVQVGDVCPYGPPTPLPPTCDARPNLLRAMDPNFYSVILDFMAQ